MSLAPPFFFGFKMALTLCFNRVTTVKTTDKVLPFHITSRNFLLGGRSPPLALPGVVGGMLGGMLGGASGGIVRM